MSCSVSKITELFITKLKWLTAFDSSAHNWCSVEMSSTHFKLVRLSQLKQRSVSICAILPMRLKLTFELLVAF